ncbi:hypothetical protein TNCT_471631 [Trichonephila clavata]|uniref:Uncharacterized protein n=1 Tax=Trichonephila clavata TaxID=2740835 RepID=A0A8X6GZN3_TRICU|nr:hypothetical protein TNCT_471631 [Trichonephila clavata]
MVAYWIMARCQSFTVCNLISCPEVACTTKIIAGRKPVGELRLIDAPCRNGMFLNAVIEFAHGVPWPLEAISHRLKLPRYQG